MSKIKIRKEEKKMSSLALIISRGPNAGNSALQSYKKFLFLLTYIQPELSWP